MILNIILGPMYAGKTDDIIRVYNKYISINKKVMLINHTLDKIRTGGKSVIRTHNQDTLECNILKHLNTISTQQKFLDCDIVIIDESQFFDDLYMFICSHLNTNKTFYIYGLSGDVYQHKIGYILDLIPLADTIRHLVSYCIICKDGTAAPFTRKNEINNNNVCENGNGYIDIGSVDKFMSVCRAHLI